MCVLLGGCVDAMQCVSTLGHARKAIKKLLSTKWKATAIPGHGVVGIDTEWQPKTRNPTAILQAATLSHVFLFDLPALHERYPKQVRSRAGWCGTTPHCAG